jgi:hypothetical protein
MRLIRVKKDIFQGAEPALQIDELLVELSGGL